MKTEPTPVDRAGIPLLLGTRVRLLEIAAFLKEQVPADEWERLQTMVGGVFAVSEIDEYGAAWIEKWFDTDDGSCCHCLALAPHEVQVVEQADPQSVR
jgi:hypothetical protein